MANPISWLQRTAGAVGGWLNAGRVSPRTELKTNLLLREPVIVLNGGGDVGSRLGVGTPVTLVRNDGRFLRVRHDGSVITIPTTSVITGVTRTN